MVTAGSSAEHNVSADDKNISVGENGRQVISFEYGGSPEFFMNRLSEH